MLFLNSLRCIVVAKGSILAVSLPYSFILLDFQISRMTACSVQRVFTALSSRQCLGFCVLLNTETK